MTTIKVGFVSTEGLKSTRKGPKKSKPNKRFVQNNNLKLLCDKKTHMPSIKKKKKRKIITQEQHEVSQ